MPDFLSEGYTGVNGGIEAREVLSGWSLSDKYF
jgi:hypothetical protein